MQWIAAGVLAAVVAGGMVSAEAQTTRRQRRETNANRKARIARTVQDTYSHRFEVFGGGGYLRWRSGEYLKRNNEITWATSATYFLNPKLGVTGEVSGAFGNAKIPNVLVLNGAYNPQINEYFFMGGPTYRFIQREKYSVSGVVTGGEAWGIFSGGSKGIPSTTLGMWPDGFRPAVTVGANLDYNFYPNLAFRATPTWVGTTFGNSFQSNVGFNAGIVYRFGRIK
ncbi:MAG TPA: hypothetical protein VNW54_05200 [Granulicella sp.]|jgi:hypothetical protein|nr:hypothetical protein [Granulicella sp.]